MHCVVELTRRYRFEGLERSGLDVIAVFIWCIRCPDFDGPVSLDDCFLSSSVVPYRFVLLDLDWTSLLWTVRFLT